jgi:hypothetical protein
MEEVVILSDTSSFPSIQPNIMVTCATFLKGALWVLILGPISEDLGTVNQFV